MTVFQFRSDSEHYESLRPVGGDFLAFQIFDGRNIDPTWTAPPLEALPPDDWGRKLPASDFPRLLGQVPILSGRAYRALSPLIQDKVQVVSLRRSDRPEETYVALNVTNLVVALDFEASTVTRVGGLVFDISRYVFRDDLQDEVLFKDPRMNHFVFVTTPFVQMAREAGLVGAEFTPCS